MPYEWEHFDGPDKTSRAPIPVARVTLWPHRSLPRRDFARFILITFAMFMLPTLALLGTMALWGLLPFLMGALALTWYLLERSYKDGELTETLSIWSDRVELVRNNPRATEQRWDANPHWVRIEVLKTGGPVDHYLTMKGNGRTVEIGAFLSPEERVTLSREIGLEMAKAGT